MKFAPMLSKTLHVLLISQLILCHSSARADSITGAPAGSPLLSATPEPVPVAKVGNLLLDDAKALITAEGVVIEGHQSGQGVKLQGKFFKSSWQFSGNAPAFIGLTWFGPGNPLCKTTGTSLTERVHLANGNTVAGKITSINTDRITIETADGQKIVATGEISKIDSPRVVEISVTAVPNLRGSLLPVDLFIYTCVLWPPTPQIADTETLSASESGGSGGVASDSGVGSHPTNSCPNAQASLAEKMDDSAPEGPVSNPELQGAAQPDTGHVVPHTNPTTTQRKPDWQKTAEQRRQEQHTAIDLDMNDFDFVSSVQHANLDVDPNAGEPPPAEEKNVYDHEETPTEAMIDVFGALASPPEKSQPSQPSAKPWEAGSKGRANGNLESDGRAERSCGSGCDKDQHSR